MRHTFWMPSLPLPQLSYGGATLVAEKIGATTCGENTEKRDCGCLILVLNQTVAGAAVAAMQLWRGTVAGDHANQTLSKCVVAAIVVAWQSRAGNQTAPNSYVFQCQKENEILMSPFNLVRCSGCAYLCL